MDSLPCPTRERKYRKATKPKNTATTIVTSPPLLVGYINGWSKFIAKAAMDKSNNAKRIIFRINSRRALSLSLLPETIKRVMNKSTF